MHLSEITKLQFGKKTSYIALDFTAFPFWIPVTHTKISFFLNSHKLCKNTSVVVGTVLKCLVY